MKKTRKQTILENSLSIEDITKELNSYKTGKQKAKTGSRATAPFCTLAATNEHPWRVPGNSLLHERFCGAYCHATMRRSN